MHPGRAGRSARGRPFRRRHASCSPEHEWVKRRCYVALNTPSEKRDDQRAGKSALFTMALSAIVALALLGAVLAYYNISLLP